MESDRIHHHATLDALVASAVCAGAPIAVAEEACRATTRRFGGSTGAANRVEAYYWGVVRRRALRGAAPRLARSLLAASLAAELTEAGHSPSSVRREVACAYGEQCAEAIYAVTDGSDRAA
jgi:hypothetical protein